MKDDSDMGSNEEDGEGPNDKLEVKRAKNRVKQRNLRRESLSFLAPVLLVEVTRGRHRGDDLGGDVSEILRVALTSFAPSRSECVRPP